MHQARLEKIRADRKNNNPGAQAEYVPPPAVTRLNQAVTNHPHLEGLVHAFKEAIRLKDKAQIETAATALDTSLLDDAGIDYIGRVEIRRDLTKEARAEIQEGIHAQLRQQVQNNREERIRL